MSLPSYLLLSLNSTGPALGRDGGNIITTKFTEMDKGCIRRNLIFTEKFMVIHTSKGIILFDLDHAEDK